LAVISFDPKLYNCLSVLDNIQLGQNVQFNQMVQAAANVGVHGYIPGLPQVQILQHFLALINVNTEKNITNQPTNQPIKSMEHSSS
jgi:ABC-type multidrug transport system fused ATPase/permease subunit